MLNDKTSQAVTLSRPDGYALLELGINLHPKQKEVLNALFEGTKTKVTLRAANEIGKTSCCCVVAILFAIDILNAQVVSTSATYRQITKQLIPYLKNYAYKFPNWEFLDNCIKVNGEVKYIGFSTSEDSKFQGYHEQTDKPLLIIVDEAAGVKDQIFQSIGRCNPTWLLVCGSPLGPEGVFYSIENEPNMYKQFKHFKITKHECLKKDGWWLEEEDIDNFVKMWGRDNPLVLSSVYAEFATNIEGGVITLQEIENCLRTPAIPDYTGAKHVTIDFAAGGGETVIAFRRGNETQLIKCWKEQDTVATCREIVNQLDMLRSKYNITANDTSGDADGMGTSFISILKDYGWKINSFHGNSTADSDHYKNKIAECWLETIRKIRNTSIIMPDDQLLKLQLTSRKSFRNSSGKLQLESKEDMKARNIPSPDRADAFCMACGSNPSSGCITQVFVPTLPTAKRYTGYF